MNQLSCPEHQVKIEPSNLSIALVGCSVLSGVGALLTLPKLRDGSLRLRALAALTLGLFIGLSTVWTGLAIYLKHRFAGDSILVVPYWGVEIGVFIASLLCGCMFAERSAGNPLPPSVTNLGQKWVASPWRAFRSGVTIGILTPAGMATLCFLLWAVSTLFR